VTALKSPVLRHAVRTSAVRVKELVRCWDVKRKLATRPYKRIGDGHRANQNSGCGNCRFIGARLIGGMGGTRGVMFCVGRLARRGERRGACPVGGPFQSGVAQAAMRENKPARCRGPHSSTDVHPRSDLERDSSQEEVTRLEFQRNEVLRERPDLAGKEHFIILE
jgi:hypothetical protein